MTDLDRRGLLETFCSSCGLFLGVELSRRVRCSLGNYYYPYAVSQLDPDLEGYDLGFLNEKHEIQLLIPSRHFLIFGSKILEITGSRDEEWSVNVLTVIFDFFILIDNPFF